MKYAQYNFLIEGEEDKKGFFQNVVINAQSLDDAKKLLMEKINLVSIEEIKELDVPLNNVYLSENGIISISGKAYFAK